MHMSGDAVVRGTYRIVGAMSSILRPLLLSPAHSLLDTSPRRGYVGY
jgi:hypothetical protein